MIAFPGHAELMLAHDLGADGRRSETERAQISR